MIKLSNEWILYELLAQHDYILTHGYADQPYEGFVKKSENKLIKKTKEILNKQINSSDIPNLKKEIEEFFYETKSLVNSKYGKLALLGPIGKSYINLNQCFLDLKDIMEVYVNASDFSGSIKTKSTGWVSWILLEGDRGISKSLASKYQYLVTMNHHKMESSQVELFEKVRKYEDETMSRHLKRFISSRFWFHEDLEKLWRQISYIPFIRYGEANE